jgi:3-oxoacyl-[acyl-carrier protein] reductase
MTIPLRENRGESVEAEDLDQGGPQHVAPICAWLATGEAASITSEIFHTGRGGVAIMQQPKVIKQFQKSSGVWTLDELDEVVPQLIEARKANVAAADETGSPIQV